MQRPETPDLSDLPDEGVTTDTFRQLMRHHAGGVTVIASHSNGRRAGITATAVTPLSDAPPTVLVCVRQTSGAHQLIREGSAFSVNFLSDEQHAIADLFAGRTGVSGDERFAGLPWSTLATGTPVLDGTLAVLDCRLLQAHAFTTHTIFLGRVIDGRADDSHAPLLYFRGSYRGIA